MRSSLLQLVIIAAILTSCLPTTAQSQEIDVEHLPSLNDVVDDTRTLKTLWSREYEADQIDSLGDEQADAHFESLKDRSDPESTFLVGRSDAYLFSLFHGQLYLACGQIEAYLPYVDNTDANSHVRLFELDGDGGIALMGMALNTVYNSFVLSKEERAMKVIRECFLPRIGGPSFWEKMAETGLEYVAFNFTYGFTDATKEYDITSAESVVFVAPLPQVTEFADLRLSERGLLEESIVIVNSGIDGVTRLR